MPVTPQQPATYNAGVGYPVNQVTDGNLTLVDVYGTGAYGILTAAQVTANLVTAPNIGIGLKFLTGAGLGIPVGQVASTITTATITSAQNAGYAGIFLDPLYSWDFSGLVLNGVSNFTIASAMQWSIGVNGNINVGATHVKTDTSSPADGIQLYATSPVSSPTTGLIFRGLVFQGTHSNAAVHLGGGVRDCVFEHCLFYNPSTAVGSFGIINDTALSNNNSENNVFIRPGFAGGYGGYGIGLADQTQHANDCDYYSPKFSSGTYSLQINAGGNHHMYGAYDRSSPSGAIFYNHGGGLVCRGDEHLVNLAGGVTHLLDAAASITELDSCNISVGANATTITVSNGRLTCRGQQRVSGTVNVTGSGQVDFSDPQLATASLTITGTGTARLASVYANGASPTFTSFTGTTVYNSAMQAQTPAAGTAMVLNTTPTIISWTAPSDGNPHTVWFGGTVHVTSAQTGGVLNLTGFDAAGNAFTSQVDGGGHGTGEFTLTARQLQVQAGQTVALVQASGFTAGAASVNASLWGA